MAGDEVSFHGYKQAPEGVLKVLLPNGTLSVLIIGTRWRQGWGDTLMGRHLPPPSNAVANVGCGAPRHLNVRGRGKFLLIQVRHGH